MGFSPHAQSSASHTGHCLGIKPTVLQCGTSPGDNFDFWSWSMWFVHMMLMNFMPVGSKLFFLSQTLTLTLVVGCWSSSKQNHLVHELIQKPSISLIISNPSRTGINTGHLVTNHKPKRAETQGERQTLKHSNSCS